MSKPSSSKTSISTTPSHSDFIFKLRRLKIEENLLLQSMKKLDNKTNYSGVEFIEQATINDSHYNSTLKKLKDSYLYIRNLFEDLKTISCSRELLAELDIEEIKCKVLELENALKQLKINLDKELNSLKTAEQDIIKQIEEINLKDSNFHKKRPKIPSANLNQIVPSPVRLLMTSPLKCREVQDFQDFMKNSPNRYGGWIEYQHNIFVKYWQKHFAAFENSDNEPYVEKLAYENFIEDVLFKLQGVDKQSLISHVEWYKKYLFLKERQQNAINKWKSTRRSVKKNPEYVIKGSTQNRRTDDQINKRAENNINEMTCNFIALSENSKENPNNKKKLPRKHVKLTRQLIENDDTERLMKPTEQWLSRSYDQNPTKQQINHIENIEKLRIPNWRLYL